MWEKFKFWFVLVLITALIWFAAGQNVGTSQTFRIPMRVVSDDPARYASIAEGGSSITLTVSMHGRRGELRDFQDLISSKNVFEAAIEQGRDASPRPQSMPSRDLLERVKQIRRAPLTIESVEPRSVIVRIDNYETVHHVRVESSAGDLRAIATATPSEVSVRLPRFAAETLRADPVAVADAEKQIRSGSKPDGTFKVKVPLHLRAFKEEDPQWQVKILPSDTVILAGQIEALTRTKRIGPIQVTFSIPNQVQEDFRVVVDEAANLRPDIDVTGPKDSIEQLDPREVRAFVDVLAADSQTPRTRIRRAVQFVLPPGFALAPGSTPYEVQFELEPRKTAAAAK